MQFIIINISSAGFHLHFLGRKQDRKFCRRANSYFQRLRFEVVGYFIANSFWARQYCHFNCTTITYIVNFVLPTWILKCCWHKCLLILLFISLFVLWKDYSYLHITLGYFLVSQNNSLFWGLYFFILCTENTSVILWYWGYVMTTKGLEKRWSTLEL